MVLKHFLLQVFYIDFGNEEEVATSSLYRMPSELIRLPALCVSLTVDPSVVDGAKYGNTEKNIARAYKTLSEVEKLFISLNQQKEVTFYDHNNIRIHIKLSKKKEKLSSGFCLDTIEEKEELNSSVDADCQSHFVQEVVSSLLHGRLNIEEDPDLEEGGEGLRDATSCDEEVPSIIASVEDNDVIEAGEDNLEVEVKDEERREEPTVVHTATTTIELELESAPVPVEDCCKEAASDIIGGKQVSVENDEDGVSDPMSSRATVEGASSEGSGQFQEQGVDQANNELESDNASSPEGKDPKYIVTNGYGRQRRNSSTRRNKSFNAKGQKPPMKGKVEPKIIGEWRVGDSVLAFWTHDGVWRKGIIHDLDLVTQDVFIVAAEDVGVKATRSNVKDLRPPNIPADLLNYVEEELCEKTLVKEENNNGRRRVDRRENTISNEAIDHIISSIGEVPVQEILEESNLEVLSTLIPRMNKSQIQTMISIVCEHISHFLTSSSNSFSLVETLLHSGCDQDKRRILGSSMTLLPKLLSSEAGYCSLVSLLSSWPHFMELESSVVTHEDVVLLGSTLFGIKFMTTYLSIKGFLSRTFLDLIVATFDTLRTQRHADQLLITLARVGSGTVSSWMCDNFESIVRVNDIIKGEFSCRIIPQLDQAAVAAITRFLLRRNLMMTGSLSPVGSRLLVPLVRSVMRMEAEAELRSAVLLDLGRHAAELCRSQHGVAVIKSLDGFI